MEKSSSPSLERVFDAYVDFVLLGGRLRRGAVPAGDPFELQKTLQAELAVARRRCEGEVGADLLDRIEYAVVGFLDESALSSGDAVSECWRAGTLEGVLYETGIAGELFEDRLDEALENPTSSEPFLLICLLCLLEGFQGELARDPDAERQIGRKIADIHAALRRAVPPVEPVSEGVVRAERASEGFVPPLWLVPVLGLCVLLVAAVVLWSMSGSAVDAFALELTAAEAGH